MRVIAITGKSGSGKDTLALMLKTYLEWEGKRVAVIHFADPLKLVCEKIYNWNGEKDVAGRRLLQYVGTDLVRTRNANFWCNFIKDIAVMFYDEVDYLIIPDVRFPNEIEVFKKNETAFNPVLIKIKRDSVHCGLNEEQKKHLSEVAMDSYTADKTIDNNKTKAHLLKEAAEILEYIETGK